MIIKYKDELKKSMEFLATDPKVVFLGYGIKYGGMGAGSFKDVPKGQLIETPLAENLMMGLAIGMSLEGFTPVVFIERFDFILNAMDAVVNHLDKVKVLSNGEYSPKVIIRCVVGGKTSPFFTGITHIQDYTEQLKRMVSFPVIKLDKISGIQADYTAAKLSILPTIIVEEKDKYNDTENI